MVNQIFVSYFFWIDPSSPLCSKKCFWSVSHMGPARVSLEGKSGPLPMPDVISCMKGRDPFSLLPQVAWDRDKLVLSSAPPLLWWDTLRVLLEVWDLWAVGSRAAFPHLFWYHVHPSSVLSCAAAPVPANRLSILNLRCATTTCEGYLCLLFLCSWLSS